MGRVSDYGLRKDHRVISCKRNRRKLVTANLPNWNGKEINIPRTEVSAWDREDMKCVGIYFLVYQRDDEFDFVYIGEAENVPDRKTRHLRDYQSEKENHYWNTTVIFIGRDRCKALIRYLDNQFVEIAKECGRYMILAKNTYKNTVSRNLRLPALESSLIICKS